MKKSIAIFIAGIFAGVLFINFSGCGPYPPPITPAKIKASDAYSNPDSASFREPHDFFNHFKANMDSSTDLFAGLSIDKNVLDSLCADTTVKAKLYIALALDSGVVEEDHLINRQKHIFIASEPDSGGVWNENNTNDAIWKIAYNSSGKQVLERINNPLPVNYAYYREKPKKDDLFNKIFKYTVSITDAYGGTICKCKPCGCNSMQGGNIAAAD